MSMSEALPFAQVEWVDPHSVNLNKMRDDDEFDYIFEVDLNYRKYIYESHKDLPLSFEHMIPPTSRFKYKKLLTALYNKEKYGIEYKNLKQALELGLNLTKIHSFEI